MESTRVSTVFVHPAPPLAYSNQQLLKSSIGLCCVILAFSLSLFGEFSLWISPSAFILTIAHNLTILVLSNQERKGTRPVITGKRLPATATRASFICAFLLAALWCGAVAVLIVFCAFAVGNDGDAGYARVVPWFEWIFALGEVAVLIVFGVGRSESGRLFWRWGMALGSGIGSRIWSVMWMALMKP
ncbi:hypothetical protein CPB84DRAFT_1768476, partial [Gymnopilus junonius]